MRKLALLIAFLLAFTLSPAWAAAHPEPTSFSDPITLPEILPSGGDYVLNQEVEGQTPGGAYFKIVVPDGWNGDLVIWNHGFSLDEPDTVDDLGPLVDFNLEEGYAVAASSYRQAGWALFNTAEDLSELYQAFVIRFGAPGQVYVYGASLGGIVTAQAIEQAKLGNVVGAMPLCGAVAGSRIWDGSLDLRLIYDVIAEGMPGAAIPGGAAGLPEDSNLTEIGLGFAVNAATGILLPEDVRTSQQQANLDKVLQVSGIPESFLLTDMWFSTFGLSDLVHDPLKLDGVLAVGNVGVDYDDSAIDSAVQRVSPDPVANNHFGKYYIPSGEVGDIKIVQLHTDKDGLVIVENAGEYALVVPAANLTTAIVVEEEPTHCGFTDAEVVAAWQALEAWVAGGPQPTAVTIQTACESVPAEHSGPCRIDPSFVIPDMDGRIRPRTRWQVLFQPNVMQP